MPEDKKKTRQRLTVTSMYEAIYDIETMLHPEGNFSMRTVALTTNKTTEGTIYVASLFRGMAGSDEEPVYVTHAESPVDFEDAVARLLTQVKEQFEEHRKKLLGGLDSVLERHHGALRGARSKLREKQE